MKGPRKEGESVLACMGGMRVQEQVSARSRKRRPAGTGAVVSKASRMAD